MRNWHKEKSIKRRIKEVGEEHIRAKFFPRDVILLCGT